MSIVDYTPHLGTRATRRALLATGAAGASVLAACTAGQSAPATSRPQALPPGELEFWNHWADNTPGGQGWQAVIGKFQAATPGVTVRRVVYASSMLFDKVIAAASAGTPPHLIDLSQTQYAAAVSRGMLVKLDPYMKGNKTFNKDVFVPAIQSTIALDKGIFAVPSEFDTLLLFYNADLLQEAGIPLPQASWHWEQEFLDAARRATRDTGGPETQRFGSDHIAQWWSTQWWVPVWSNGGDIVTKDHKKSALGDTRAVAGLQFLADLKHRWRVTPTDDALKTSPQGRPFFESGRLALRLSGSFYYAQVKDGVKFKWGVAQVPQGSAGTVPGIGGWFVGAGAGTKKEDAQAAFMAYYLQPDHFAEFLPFVSWMPPLKAIERPPIVTDAQHWSAMTGAAQAARALPTIAQMDDVIKVANDGLAPVFDTGTVTAQAAVQQFSPKMDALLAQS